MVEGIRLFIKLIQISEQLNNRIMKSGTSTLDTNETLPLKMELAEVMAELEYATISEEFSDVEKAMVFDLIMKTRMNYRIQSGIYTTAECRVAERSKHAQN
jgi:hypothetical protein